MNKDLIKARFSKNLDSYDKEAKIQKVMADRLITFVKNNKVNNVLEIGCGTGFLTKAVKDNIDYQTYTAIDIVDECGSYLKKIDENIQFVSDDVENFLKNRTEKYDLIVSNASLQWVENFEETIKKLVELLNPNGELVFSTFGKENFREIYHLLGTGLNYYSTKNLHEIFDKYSPLIEEEIRIMAFQTPKDVLKHLKATGVNAIDSQSWTKTDLKNFENGYLNICSIRPTLSYNPVYIKIEKK